MKKIKRFVLPSLLFLFLFSLNSKLSAITPPVDSSQAFDFWVGEWKVWWYGKDSAKVYGSNRIEKILDGKVLQEHFETSKGFKGTSISVYHPKKKEWHQAWADNSGGYIDLYGRIDGDKRIFQTQPTYKDNKIIVKRMVFYNISKNSFTWDWEVSIDGGENWKLSWRIFYERK